MAYNRSEVQIQSSIDRFCYGCGKKSSLHIVETGKGYWIKKCRRCGSLKYWWDIRTHPEGISDFVSKYRN